MNASQTKAMMEVPLKVLAKQVSPNNVHIREMSNFDPNWIVRDADELVDAAAQILDSFDRKKRPELYWKMLTIYRCISYLHTRTV